MANTTTSTSKMTKAQKFAILAELPDVKSNPMLSEFIAHEVELLNKKNSAEKKPTAQQTANEGIKSVILETLGDSSLSITEMQKINSELAELSNQKISALIGQMVKSGSVVREEIKRKAYFKIA